TRAPACRQCRAAGEGGDLGCSGTDCGPEPGVDGSVRKAAARACAPGADRRPGEPIDRRRTGVHPGHGTDGPGIADELLPSRNSPPRNNPGPPDRLNLATFPPPAQGEAGWGMYCDDKY